MNSSSNSSNGKRANLVVRKLLGRAYLRADRLPEALNVYHTIYSETPDDTDVLFILGNLYRLAGCSASAAKLIKHILQLNPNHVLASNLLEELGNENPDGMSDCDPLSPESVERLLSRLQSEVSTAAQKEIRCAADGLEVINPDSHTGEPGEQQLLPALIEMNIRQARAVGSVEIAEALLSLQINLSHQAEDLWADDLLKDDLLDR